MTVHMDVPEVRAGGGALRTLAPRVRGASSRVERPAAAAAEQNAGFAAGGAGGDWQAAFAADVASVESRQIWQGEQVAGCADDMEASDAAIGGRFNTIAGEIPAARPK
ncbi:hypothetical protein [Glycomyces arizonensis]|uniref:hypothetical protein n=1 Tax=Glycomyces arizonensis TaxID=256035 RepID=UPI000429803D|nr:hypothetical protein [Glycomyces arizonensis]